MNDFSPLENAFIFIENGLYCIIGTAHTGNTVRNRFFQFCQDSKPTLF